MVVFFGAVTALTCSTGNIASPGLFRLSFSA
jgi:hypothetical protein